MNRSKDFLLVTCLLLATMSLSSQAQQADRKISSDSSFWDLSKNQMKYSGNAVFSSANLTIKGEQIVAQKTPKGGDEAINVSGKPASFTERQPQLQELTQLNAENINYQVNTKLVTASTRVHLLQKNPKAETIEINGDKLTISQKTNYHLSVLGSPLTVTIVQAGQAPISAQAEKLFYDKQNQQFELTSNVILTSMRETMKADKVIYNMATGTLEVPKSPNSQVEIIQSTDNP